MTQLTRHNRIKLVCIAVIAWVAIVTMYSSGPGAADTNNGSGNNSAATSEPQKKKKVQKEDPKSSGCLTCHEGSESMHQSATDFELGVGCVDCHGGNAEPAITPGDAKGSATYNQAKDKAHIQPRFP